MSEVIADTTAHPPPFTPEKIAFIGAGNMTSAIIRGMVKAGYPTSMLMATNRSPEKLDVLANELGIQTSTDNAAALDFADTIVLAVKPQMLAEMCAALPDSKQDKSYISIAAGVSVARIQEMLDAPVQVVRTMPNTPSAIGMGMTGLYAQNNTVTALRVCAEYCLKQVGQTLWVTHEDDINTVIAAAGSSPAYVFLFAEAMQAKTQELGLAEQDAKLLVAQALAGAGQMLLENPDIDFATLRANVTSKGGTTAQAIASFKQANLTNIIADAMQTAVDRAREMQANI
jgi:pyrroline-5-carboxylate reductase